MHRSHDRVNSKMHRCNVDPTGRILAITYGGFVGPQEVRQCLETVRSLAGRVTSGFVLFTDSTHLEEMELECAPVLGEIMEHRNAPTFYFSNVDSERRKRRRRRHSSQLTRLQVAQAT
jgi:hypothetical protein